MNDITITYDNTLTADEYNSLREQVGWSRLTEKRAEEGLKHTTFIISARSNGKAVAMGRALFDFGYTAYIGDIIVSPEYQGQGIGKRIMESLINQVESSVDVGDMLMFVITTANGKEPFYKKFGFEERPSENGGAGMVRRVIVK